jgi:uncharacterized membrane protein YsdA (DUF1294 family)
MTVADQKIFCLYLIAINIVAFVQFWLDKRYAETNRNRIAERTLLATAFYGGSLGAMVAQQIFRHKTRKQPFRARLISIAVVHLFIAILIASPALRDLIVQFLSNIATMIERN